MDPDVSGGSGSKTQACRNSDFTARSYDRNSCYIDPEPEPAKESESGFETPELVKIIISRLDPKYINNFQQQKHKYKLKIER